jgi:hypothetical protein
VKLKKGIVLILMMMVVMLWGCGDDPNKEIKITGVSLENTSTTVEKNTVVTLPQFATAEWSDGSKTSVGVIWDTTTVDTSVAETSKSYTGTVAGWDGKLIYTVNVAKGQVAEYIKSVELITTTATVELNAAFNLPSKVMATWSTGEKREAAVTWDKTVDTSKANTYTFEGTVDGYDAEKVKFTLIVKKEEIVNKIEKVYLSVSSNSVAQNSAFTLPAQGIAVWTTGEETPIALTWDKAVSTATVVTTVYTGTATGTTYTVQYVLTVTKSDDVIVTPKTLEFIDYSTITVVQKTAFLLPVYGIVTMNNGEKKVVTLTWNRGASTAAVGTFNYTASYTENGIKVTKVFTLIVTKEEETPTITSLSLATYEATVYVGTNYVLPSSATATWTNGSKTEVALTWDKTVNTATVVTTVFTGKTTGTNQTVVFTLKVEEGIKPPTITALNLTTNISTVQEGTSFTLPAEATATLTDGSKKQVTITWDKVASTAVVGTYTFIGSNESAPTIQVVYVLVVTEIKPEVTLQGLVLTSTTGTVEVKKAFTLPTTGIAIYSNNTTKPVAVTWDKVVDTSKVGPFTYTASYTEGTETRTAVFTLTVTPVEIPVKATKIAFATNKITLQVKANGTYELPKLVTATYDNGTTKEVTITSWSPSATASIATVETTSYIAIFSEKYSDGTSVLLTAIYTVEVTEEPQTKTLETITLTKTSDSVGKGTSYTLPATATAVYSDASTKPVAVTWDKAVNTTVAGITVYTASYTENGVTKTALFTLTVTEDVVKATSFKISQTSGMVVKGAVYSLPTKGTITFSNGTTKEVGVTWNKGVNTGTVGVYEYIGSNTEAGTLTVKFTLTVEDGTTPVLTLSDISEVKAGETFEVAVNASFFSKTVAAVDVRLVYDATMLQGLDDATSMLSGMKIVKHIGGEQDVSVVLDTASVISGTIFKIKFKALKDGKTTIRFSSGTQLLGSAGDKLTVTTTDTAEVSIGTGGEQPNYSKLEISDATGNTNGETEVTVSATGFTETSVGFDIVLNYDTTYLDITRDGNGNASSSIVTSLNSSFWSDLIIVKEATAGKIVVAIITNKTTPLTLNGDLFKVKFKTKSLATTGTTVSFGEVKVANSTDGFLTSVTTTDTGKVVINKVESKSSFEIGDATGSNPGYVNVKLSGTGFTETAAGVEFIVNYDATYLEIENLTNDVTLTGALTGGRKIVNSPSAGKVKIAAVIDNNTFTANGELVNIKFKTKKAGSTTVSYEKVDLGNALATGKITSTITDTGTVTLNQVVSVATTVELSASSTSFTVGGSATLTAVVKDQNGNVMSGATADIYNGTTKAGSNTYSFSSSTEGTYTFTAKSGALTSTAVTVTVNKAGEVVTGGPYATNGVGVGKNKTITIDGAISDWSEDMLIAQGAAWDIANNWKGGHENCVLDSYALYAAWDDTNLYIAWQMVNTTDTWANPGDGPLSDGGRVLDVPLIIALNTGKKTAMTGKMANGKLLWDALQLEFTTPVDHLFLMSGKVGLGTPAMFTAADATGGASYTAPYCQNFKITGIKYAMAMDALPSKIMMLEGSTSPLDVVSPTATWVDALTKGHDKKYDSFYEMSIPLSVLGIDKAYIESNGIGAMQIATRGVSAIDSIPHDPTTLDNALGDCAVDPSSSHEKDDTDIFTVPLAKIGKK